jgi:hypothetical protein
MILDRTTPCSQIEIKAPRWKQRVVGVASFRVQTHNQIDITYQNKESKRLYPYPLYASGELIRACPTQNVKNGVMLYLVPIDKLEVLERS